MHNFSDFSDGTMASGKAVVAANVNRVKFTRLSNKADHSGDKLVGRIEYQTDEIQKLPELSGKQAATVENVGFNNRQNRQDTMLRYCNMLETPLCKNYITAVSGIVLPDDTYYIDRLFGLALIMQGKSKESISLDRCIWTIKATLKKTRFGKVYYMYAFEGSKTAALLDSIELLENQQVERRQGKAKIGEFKVARLVHYGTVADSADDIHSRLALEEKEREKNRAVIESLHAKCKVLFAALPLKTRQRIVGYIAGYKSIADFNSAVLLKNSAAKQFLYRVNKTLHAMGLVEKCSYKKLIELFITAWPVIAGSVNNK